jgi:large subunit ribosomal protein L32
MAVPKKRTGHSAQGSRRANWKATKPETTKCPNCGETVLTHTVCTACGTYKGQPVKLADKAAAAAATAPAKKTAKKSTKKAAPKAEETKVEEVKAEETVEEKTEE